MLKKRIIFTVLCVLNIIFICFFKVQGALPELVEQWIQESPRYGKSLEKLNRIEFNFSQEVLKEIKARRSPLRTHRQWAQEQQLELYQASTYLDKRDYVAFANFLDLYKDKKLPSEPIHSVFSPLERQLNKLKSRLDGEEEEGTKRTLQELYDYYQNFYEDIKSYRIEAAGIAEYVSEHFDVYYEGAWYEAPADTIRDITSRDRLGHRKKETEEGTSSVHFRERLCFKEILDPTTGNPLEEEFVYGFSHLWGAGNCISFTRPLLVRLTHLNLGGVQTEEEYRAENPTQHIRGQWEEWHLVQVNRRIEGISLTKALEANPALSPNGYEDLFMISMLLRMADWHGENLLVEQETGQLIGIDNDRLMGPRAYKRGEDVCFGEKNILYFMPGRDTALSEGVIDRIQSHTPVLCLLALREIIKERIHIHAEMQELYSLHRDGENETEVDLRFNKPKIEEKQWNQLLLDFISLQAFLPKKQGSSITPFEVLESLNPLVRIFKEPSIQNQPSINDAMYFVYGASQHPEINKLIKFSPTEQTWVDQQLKKEALGEEDTSFLKTLSSEEKEKVVQGIKGYSLKTAILKEVHEDQMLRWFWTLERAFPRAESAAREKAEWKQEGGTSHVLAECLYPQILIDPSSKTVKDPYREVKRYNRYGRRPVARGEVEGEGLYFKFIPELPIYEEAIGELSRLLGMEGLPPTALFKVHGLPVLVLQEVKGVLLVDGIKDPELEKRLDVNHTAQMILLSILTNPGDGKPDNFIVTPESRLIPIDNEQSFYMGIYAEEKQGRKRVKIGVKSLLACLKQVRSPLTEEVKKRYESYLFKDVLDDWLNFLDRKNTAYAALFGPEERNRFWRVRDPNKQVYLGVPFQKGVIKDLYHKMVWIQEQIKQSSEISLIELWSYWTPQFISHVRKNLKEEASFKERVQAVLGPLYGVSESSQMPSTSSVVHLFRSHKLAPKNVLEQLKTAEIMANTISETKKELFAAVEEKSAQALKELGLGGVNIQEDERRLLELDLSDKPADTQQAVLDLLLRGYEPTDYMKILTLRGFNARLRDNTLGNLLKARPNYQQLRSLTITKTPLVTEGIFNTLQTLTHLQTLTLKNLTVLKAVAVYGIFSYSEVYFPALEVLDASHNPNLKEVRLKAPELKTLDLSYCSSLDIEKLLLTVPKLESIKLKNSANLSDDLLNFLGGEHNEESLSLVGQAIDTTSLNLLAFVLPNSALTELDLGDNGLGAVGARALAAALPNSWLTQLNLGDNSLGADGALAIAKALPKSALTELDLRLNGIGAGGARALAAALLKSRLTKLDLGDNGIGDGGALAIAADLPTSRLTQLNLGFNSIGDGGARTLAAALPYSRLAQLNLRDNGIGDDGACVLAKALPKRVLTWLNLSDNGGTLLQNVVNRNGQRTEVIL